MPLVTTAQHTSFQYSADEVRSALGLSGDLIRIAYDPNTNTIIIQTNIITGKDIPVEITPGPISAPPTDTIGVSDAGG
jgi:hypothetical protein